LLEKLIAMSLPLLQSTVDLGKSHGELCFLLPSFPSSHAALMLLSMPTLAGFG